ncbi:MAG: beta-N-acetylhexosaminidase [Dethiobacteria bacterium]
MRINIIPQPNSIVMDKSAKPFTMEDRIKVVDDRCGFFAGKNLLKFLNGINMEIDEQAVNTVEFIIDPDIKDNEEYCLKIKENNISIRANGDRGLFYGVQSLKQIIFDCYIDKRAVIPALEINDRPRFRYRGYMLDIVRHFFDRAEILRLIELLSLQKYNIFHLHLTDDQGWRVEMKKYPNLITTGSKRSQTLGDRTPHGGYLTREDLAEIIKYAAEHFMTIVPEIDMPGHFTSAIASYPELGCDGKQIPVATSFGIKSDIACAGKETTYEFIHGVLDEITALFPSPYIHIGGDEAEKSHWAACPHCREIMAGEKLPDLEALQGYFTNKIVEYLSGKGKKAIVWNESIYSGFLDERAICQYWSDGKTPQRVIEEINRGRETIISKFTPLYLDYPFAMHSLRAVYEFDPVPEGVDDKFRHKIMGVETPLWTEYIEDREQIDYMSFPRVCAVSELSWTDPPHKNYDNFLYRLRSFHRILDALGVKYAPLSVTDPAGFEKISQMLKFVPNFLKNVFAANPFSQFRTFINMKKARKQ